MATRILRVVRSRLLKCDCFVGVYETYDGRSVEIIDSRGAACGDRAHQPGAILKRHESPPDEAGPDSNRTGL